MTKKIIERINKKAKSMDFDDLVTFVNDIRSAIHDISPFKNEPVDFVKWIKSDNVIANDYNPNKVAPPEMELLEVSIINDGYTQPIVTWQNDDKEKTEVIDGFHRNRVGKESIVVRDRIKGYLPIVNIRTEQSSKNDRMASTIRHNRARGKHQVDAMSEIVIELKNRNWTNKRISNQLGMDEEEVLRLCQISGLEHLFNDTDFSNAWVSDEETSDYELISDDINDEVMGMHRIPHENDDMRIYHTFDKWECHKAGFYSTSVKGKSADDCKEMFCDIMRDIPLFEELLFSVLNQWVFSCEHYLTNRAMNRIAWLGQAAVCLGTGVPSKYSGAWFDLNEDEKELANSVALMALNKWLLDNGYDEVDIFQATNSGRQVELY